MTEHTKALYSAHSSFYDFFFNGLLRYGAGVAAHLRGAVTMSRGMRVLDAGCGMGSMTKALVALARQKGIADVEFFAFDLTPAMLAPFREWAALQPASPKIEIREANVLDPEQLPESWVDMDLVVTSAMLEYVPKDRLPDALHGLRQRLTPNGRLILYITRRNWFTYFLIQRWWAANTYGRAELVDILERGGFRNVRFTRIPLPYTYLHTAMFAVTAQAE